MNKITKVALCISLVGIGVFVWTQVAAAKGKPAKTPVVVTFLAGDVAAKPQALPGPFTATIDFLKYIPFICPTSPAGGEEVLRFLQTKNPITYTSLSVELAGTPLCSRLDFVTNIDGVSYTVTMNAFISGTGVTSTPGLDTVNLLEGRFAIAKGRKIAVTAGDPVRQVNLDFTMTK
jgi:hypothetical protein